jgi:hypothetical protein
MEQTECSENSAYKIQTPGNYPEENIQHGVDVFDNAPNLKVRPSIPYFLQTNVRLKISTLCRSSGFTIYDHPGLSLHSSESLCIITQQSQPSARSLRE